MAKVLAVGAEALLPARPIPSVSREPNLAKITFFFHPYFLFQGQFWAESIPEPRAGWGLEGTGAQRGVGRWHRGHLAPDIALPERRFWAFFLKATIGEALTVPP